MLLPELVPPLGVSFMTAGHLLAVHGLIMELHLQYHPIQAQLASPLCVDAHTDLHVAISGAQMGVVVLGEPHFCVFHSHDGDLRVLYQGLQSERNRF